MTALLEDRVACFLADRPGSSFLEIQRAIPCLTKTLAEILENPLFTERNGCWRLGETREPTGGARVSPSGLGTPDPSAPHPRAAQDTQLALTGDGFRKQAAA